MPKSPLNFKIKELAPGLNEMLRQHFRERGRMRDRWTQEILAQRGGAPPRLQKASVLIRRYYARNPLELDNLYASAKIPLDALVHAGILLDDNLKVLIDLTMMQDKVAKVDQERTEITVLELELSMF